MFERLDDEGIQIINKAREITWTEYEMNGDYINVADYKYIIADLITEIEHIKEEYEDFKKDVEDNYRHIPVEEQVEYNPNF